ncbi:MAG: TfoX/Sxy family protein [Geminicoccaceae bacterium]|nr:TfoX/Sxy family protein [Geminicoccaceae bacterium]
MGRGHGFVALVEDLLRPLGGVTVRRMFGGYGIFKSGVMFGLIADDRLYLKTDQGNRANFEAADLEAFVYEKQGRATAMSYNRAPDEGFDDPEVMLAWASEAFAAACRQRSKTSRGRTA